MTDLLGKSILIVDGVSLSTFHLRARLIEQGCRVHVVGTMRAALTVAHRNRLDAVFLEYSESSEARAFCETLAALDIPVIFTAAPPDAHAMQPASTLAHSSSIRSASGEPSFSVH